MQVYDTVKEQLLTPLASDLIALCDAKGVEAAQAAPSMVATGFYIYYELYGPDEATARIEHCVEALKRVMKSSPLLSKQ